MNNLSYVKNVRGSLKIRDISMFLISILIGKVSLIIGNIPYSIAFWNSATGYTKVISILVGTGLLISNIFVNGIMSGLELIAIITLMAGFNFLIKQYKLKEEIYEYIKIFASIFIIKFIFFIINGLLVYNLIMAIFSACIGVIMYVFFNKGVHILLNQNRFEKINLNEVLSLGLIASFVIAGLNGLNVFGINLMNVAGVLTILLMARTLGVQGSVIAGTFIGIITVLSNDLSLSIVVAYTLGSLLAGILADIGGNIGSILGFLIGNAVILYFNNSSVDVLIGIKDIILAGLVLYLIPKKYLKSSNSFVKFDLFGDKGFNNNQLQLATGVSTKLKGFSDAILELSSEFVPISQSNKALSKEDTNNFIEKTVQKVCKNCENYYECFERNFVEKYDSMNKLVNMIDKKGRLTETDIKENLFRSFECDKINELTENINNTYEIYRVNMVWRKKIGENRQLIADQLKNVCKAMDGIVKDIDIDVKYKDCMELKLLYELENNGARVDELILNKKKNEVEVIIYNKECVGMKKCKVDFETIISNVLERRMSRVGMICPQTSKGRCMQKFVSKELFKADVGISVISKDGENVCGDSHCTMQLENGKFISILSDGMGYGNKAFEKSSKVVNLLKKFLNSGFDRDIAINIVNSSFILNSLEDTYSTIDMVILDLFSGRVEFAKYGACPCYVKKDRDVKMIKAITLPAGIFRNIQFELNTIDLDEGEYIVIVSDGIIDSNREKDWLYDLIKKVKPYDAQELADIISGQALQNYNGIAEDDMTVLVIGINLKK